MPISSMGHLSPRWGYKWFGHDVLYTCRPAGAINGLVAMCWTHFAPLGLMSVLILGAGHLLPLRGFYKSHISTSGAKGV